MADDDVLTAPPADGVVVAPGADQPGTVTDTEQQRQASEARAAATKSRQRVQPPVVSSPETKPPAEGENPFLQFAGDPKDDGIALMERLRLNRQDSYYRGSLAGSMRLAALSHIASTPDGPDVDSDRKRVNDEQRDEYHKITADLAAHDLLKPWDTTLEAAAAFGGQLEGTMISPESWIGWGAKGATWLGRTAKAGLQQAGIQAATDPAVQALNTAAGVQQGGWDWQRTVVSAGLGFLIGGAGHVAGEGLEKVVGPRMARKQLLDLAREDKSFENHMINETTLASLDPSNGRALGLDENAPINRRAENAGTELAPATERHGTGPEHGFEDTVVAEKERLSQSYGAAQPKAKQLNDDARFSAFDKEVGEHVDPLLEQRGLDKETAYDLYQHYERAPGQAPEAALEDAIDRWVTVREREAIQSLENDSQWVADMKALEEHFGSESSGTHGAGEGKFRPDENRFGEGPKLDYREPITQEVPFEHSTEGTAASGDRGRAEPGGGTASRQGGATAGGREGAPAGGGRGREGTAEPAGEGASALKPEARGDQALAERRGNGTLRNEQRRAVGGTALAPDATSAAKDLTIRSLQQQVADLAKALDIPLREGRVSVPGALGVYRSKYGTVRVKEFPDFEVAVHEAGHAIEAKVGPEMTALTQQHSFELAPLDYDQGATGKRVNEGFAEWVRLYVGNPAFAQQVAPNFAQDFRSFMADAHPEMLSELDRAAAGYRAYIEAPSVDAVGAVRRSAAEEPHGLIQETRAEIKDKGLPYVIKSVLQEGYTRLLDDKAPLTRVVRELGAAIKEKTGAAVTLNAADNPDVLLRLAARSQQAAVRDMMDGVRPYHSITPEGPSLADALAEATGKPSVWGSWDEPKKAEFSHYIIARRAEFLWRKFEQGDLPNPPAAFSRADAIQAMSDLDKANPTFRNASDMVHEYGLQLLKKRFDGNLITRDLYEKLAAEEFYAPFMRDMRDKPGATGGGGGAEGPGTVSTIMRMKGSSRDILDPIESLMMQTFLVNRTIRQNDVHLALARYAERAGDRGGKYVEPIPAFEFRKHGEVPVSEILEQKARDIGMTPDDAADWAATIGHTLGEDPILGSYWKMEQTGAKGEPIAFYKEGGELKAHRLMSKKEGGHALYETMTAAPDPITDVWVQLAATSATLLRSTITTNPTFMVANYIRDQFAASILRSDYVPIAGGVRGLLDEFRQGQNAVLYGYAGGVAGGAATGPVERAVEADVNALAKKGYAVQRFTSFKGLLEVASATEAGTRNSIFATVFDAKKRAGLSDYEAMVEAAFQAQDMLDFSRHGSMTMVIRQLLPFVNAHMQGLDKASRTMIEPIINRMKTGDVFTRDSAEFKNAIAAWTKAGAVGGGLGALTAALFWEKEGYRDANPYLKGTHLVVPMGDRLLVVPKPFELSMGFTLGEYAFARLMKDDPRAGRQFIEAAWQSMQPPNPLTDLPLVGGATSLYYGKNLQTGNDIVPGTLQRLPPAQQYTDRTSEMAKWLGKQIDVSPMKIDYAIGANFGNWGRDVMALSQGINEDSPAKNFDNSVFLRRFIKDPTASSDITTRFWNYMGQTTGKYNQDVAGYDALVKGFQEDSGRAQEFLSKLPASEKAFVTLKSAGTPDGKASFSADERRLHPVQRAYDAVTVLSNLRRELTDNTFKDFASLQRMKLDPEKRRDLINNIRELSQAEMRNALVITKEPGYEGRPVFDTNDIFDRIRDKSPEIANEIATRYAVAKIYKTEAVQNAWPKLRDEIVQNGSKADVRGLTYDAKAQGFAFDGTRVRRPQKRRVAIEGSPAPQP